MQQYSSGALETFSYRGAHARRIAVAISENYIAVAALLGLVITKEKILPHQKAGLVVALVAAVALAYLTKAI